LSKYDAGAGGYYKEVFGVLFRVGSWVF